MVFQWNFDWWMMILVPNSRLNRLHNGQNCYFRSNPISHLMRSNQCLDSNSLLLSTCLCTKQSKYWLDFSTPPAKYSQWEFTTSHGVTCHKMISQQFVLICVQLKCNRQIWRHRIWWYWLTSALDTTPYPSPSFVFLFFSFIFRAVSFFHVSRFIDHCSVFSLTFCYKRFFSC